MSYAAAARLWDQALGPVLNAFRARLGLAPVSDIFYGWSLSPHRIVGLFPEWYAPRARDWPPHFVYGGFSSYDQSDSADVPADLQQPGDPIVVYCAGSAGAAGQTFFDAAVDAGRARRWRAVLLGASAWAPTRALPENVRRYDFVPLSRLLPIAAAVVHHGGLGTLALALAAGTPQIIVPMGHDHYENGRYLERLGVGRAIFDHREQSGEGLRARLEAVLQDGPLRQRCQLVAARARAESSLAGLCAEIEGASVTRAVQ